MAEKTAVEAAQRVNSKRNFSINPTMVKETAEEVAQRVNAKRLAANRESKKKSVPRNHNKSVKTGFRLKEKLPKKSCRGITRTT